MTNVGKGHIERLPSGSYRVRVYAGTDPGRRVFTGARHIGDSPVDRGVRLSPGGTIYDPADPMGKMFFNILATFAEWEVDLLRLRTREGMAIARAKGKLRGKQPKLTARQQTERPACTPHASTPSRSSWRSSPSAQQVEPGVEHDRHREHLVHQAHAGEPPGQPHERGGDQDEAGQVQDREDERDAAEPGEVGSRMVTTGQTAARQPQANVRRGARPGAPPCITDSSTGGPARWSGVSPFRSPGRAPGC